MTLTEKAGGVVSNTDLIYNQLRSSTPQICIKFTVANEFIQVKDVTLTQKSGDVLSNANLIYNQQTASTPKNLHSIRCGQ